MVGNGGTAIRVTAWCLAWREQDRQEEQVLRWLPSGLAAVIACARTLLEAS